MVIASIGLLVGVAGIAFTPLASDLAFHAIPIRWTGEPRRLASALDLRSGDAVAEIGSGGGALIVELAAHVGTEGKAFATERTAHQRDAIAQRARDAGLVVSVLEAPDLTTNLPDGCCDAVVMRLVLHHITDLRTYARSLRRAVKPGGRVAIIDFAPGALPHLADNHGVGADVAVAALREAGFTLASRDDAWGGRTYLLVLAPVETCRAGLQCKDSSR
jgi:SAM-dependent methyltransferase